ncbi:hypothetical protein LDENG_00233150 [Lucifuga dentata]|nr:hypothetical protein LDENG_00233150 [Lucifuga dentata]
MIQQGWPEHRRDVPISAQPYWDSRSLLSVYDGIVYKGLHIVVLPTLRQHMLGLIHQSHLGIVKMDYYSKFIEVDELKDQRSHTVIEVLKTQFSRHGTPTVMRTDNGPQYATEDFRDFCESYGILHRTSSPHTPHSNGEAERAVRMVKKLWNKSPDKHLALLDYRTTPLESVGLSPAQLLMGRRPRNKLPAARELLRPRVHDSHKVKQLLDRSKASQKFYYDKKRASKHRAELIPGDEVRMELYPGNSRWSPAVVIRPHDAPRSYIVDSGSKEFRRNCQHLRRSTAVANQSRHIRCDEPWTEPTDGLSNQGSIPPVSSESTVSSAERLLNTAQALTVTAYITKRGRAVKPPDRLNL